MSALDEQVGGRHYKDNFKIQPSEFITKNGLLFNEGCVIKYVCRHPYKGGRLDLEKAKHYIDIIIEEYYSKTKDTVGVCPECLHTSNHVIWYFNESCKCKCHKEEKDV